MAYSLSPSALSPIVVSSGISASTDADDVSGKSPGGIWRTSGDPARIGYPRAKVRQTADDRDLFDPDEGATMARPNSELDELPPLVQEIKLLREWGVSKADLSRLPLIATMVDDYFPNALPHHRRGRVQELLKAAAAILEGDSRTGAELALGLVPSTDLLNSKSRREVFAQHFDRRSGTVRREGHLEDRVFGQLAKALEALLADVRKS
jgi:hypothetical protein